MDSGREVSHAAAFECDGAGKSDGPNQGTTAEKRKTTATTTPKATGTPWLWS